MKKNKEVTVYHGTTADFKESLTMKGLVSRRESKEVFVTTDKKTAHQYAWAWTGGRLYEALKSKDESIIEAVGDRGLIVACKVSEDMLEIDTYNVTAEPNQFKIKNGIPAECIESFQTVEFEEFNNRENTVFARAFLVGVMRE